MYTWIAKDLMRKLKVILMAINKFGYGINDKHPKTNICNIVEFSKCGEIIWLLSYTCKHVFFANELHITFIVTVCNVGHMLAFNNGRFFFFGLISIMHIQINHKKLCWKHYNVSRKSKWKFFKIKFELFILISIIWIYIHNIL